MTQGVCNDALVKEYRNESHHACARKREGGGNEQWKWWVSGAATRAEELCVD